MENKPFTSLNDILAKLVELGRTMRFETQLIKLITLLLVIPATSATAERSFSTLRRVITYLHSTMPQKRLNSLLILHAHQDYTDSIDLTNVAR